MALGLNAAGQAQAAFTLAWHAMAQHRTIYNSYHRHQGMVFAEAGVLKSSTQPCSRALIQYKDVVLPV